MGENFFPKVSVIIPVYNVEKYLRECMESVVRQTLREIEIICVNDGSTDSSLEILQEYCSRDSRVKIIDKENSGYGAAMNAGMNAASGEYIGIVESDDFAEPQMFEVLYESAKKYDADVAKSNFWLYWEKTGQNEFFEFFSKAECGFPFRPLRVQGFFSRKNSIWSAIYRRDFLNKNGIRFLQTAGASFQDISFSFKCFVLARRVCGVYKAFVHYRQDNAASSVNNVEKKIDFFYKEFCEVQKFLQSQDESLLGVWAASLYDNVIWIYEKLPKEKRFEFLKTASAWFCEVLKKVEISQIEFGTAFWKRQGIQRIAFAPWEYHLWRCTERFEQQGFVPQKKFAEKNSCKKNAITSLQEPQHSKMQSEPFFSLIIPVYNVEKYLEACMESVFLQDFSDMEIICVDDGSKDLSPKILSECAERDRRVQIVQKQNGGLSSARNAGMRKAKGKWILFLDSDDCFCEGAIKKIFDILQKNPKIDILEFSAQAFPQEPPPSKSLLKSLSCQNKFFEKVSQKDFLQNEFLRLYVWRFAFKREFLFKNSFFFDESLSHGEDALFLLWALHKAQGTLCVSEELYCYRHFRPASLMNSIKTSSQKFAEQQLKILCALLDAGKKAGFEGCAELLEFSVDFVWGAVQNCPARKRFCLQKNLLKIFKKHGLLQFENLAKESVREFVESLKGGRAMKKTSFKAAIKQFLLKYVPPSRKNFREQNERIFDEFWTLARRLDNLREENEEIKRMLFSLKKECESDFLKEEKFKKP